MKRREALFLAMKQAQFAGVVLRWKDWLAFTDEERATWLAVKAMGQVDPEPPGFTTPRNLPARKGVEYPLEGDTAKDLNAVLERAARAVT